MDNEKQTCLQLLLQLQKVTNRLDFAEKIAKIGYWEIDIRHRRIYWSDEVYRILRIDDKNSSIKRNLIRSKIFPEDIPLYKQKIQELVKFHKKIEGNIRLLHKDSTITYCQYRASYNKEEDKINGTLQDITTMVEIHQALEQAKLDAEQANKAKSYFLAQASHDLRQPMQALGLFVNSLSEEEPLTIRQKELIKKIEASVGNLKHLLDSLLDLSKLESGGIIPKQQEFDIGNLFHRLSFEYYELSKMQGISFECEPCHYIVRADEILVERIIRNLISNAMKFTNNKVVLGCDKLAEKVEIFVLDNGAGIPKEEQDKIFQEFYQTKDGKNKVGSSGLGLTIVKKIADIIGENIKLYSETGKGSKFSFSLPLVSSK